MKFQDFPLKSELIQAIIDRGYETPTEIQAKAIPLLANSKIDFVGQAQTGTGKTAAFVLPLLNQIDTESNSIQAIILSPTRELAQQVYEEIKKFTGKLRVRSTVVYGGTSMDAQVRALKKDKPQIVVGTPGRVLDLIDRRIMHLDQAEFAILDEADEMLDMGFFDDVKMIISKLKEDKKTWMFSATMPKPILNMINKDLKDPQFVSIQKKTLSSEQIQQSHYLVRRSDMTEALMRILSSIDDAYGMIFCRTKIDTKELSDSLNAHGFPADAMHGDMSQEQRDRTMKNFRAKRIKMLVCTDVAARGIDVDNLSHVINFGLPQDIESYVHRIGRTGRAGQTGIALTIIDPSEKFRIKRLESMTKAPIARANLPNLNELKEIIVKKDLSKLMANTIDSSDLDIDSGFHTFKKEMQSLPADEMLQRMYLQLFKTRFDKFRDAAVLDLKEKAPEQRGNVSGRNMRMDSSRRDFDRGGDRGFDRGFDRGGDRGFDRRDRGSDSRGSDRGGFDRGGFDQGGFDRRGFRADRAESSTPRARSGDSFEASPDQMRLFLNMGKGHGLNLRMLLGSISRIANVEQRHIQNVLMKEDFSFINVPRRAAEQLLTTQAEISGRKIHFEVSERN